MRDIQYSRQIMLSLTLEKETKRARGMYKNGCYRETDKMSDLICENYPMVLVMSRFGISLGFGEKHIGEVCRENGVDTTTFLAVVNFLTEELAHPFVLTARCAPPRESRSGERVRPLPRIFRQPLW